jgi:NAD(P)-dependent dehydrogenase (short-subunit alcohol dehydrogenase family)
MSAAPASTAVVLGARNLGGAITRDLLDHGVRVATVARTRSDLDPLVEHGATPIEADATDSTALEGALSQAEAQIGPLDLLVNAVSVARPPQDGSGFGGGALTTASEAGFEGWTVAVAQQVFVFLSVGARALGDRGGTLVQITGAPARRTTPERGLLSAGSAAARALTHAVALELRESGVHVGLLIVDGIIDSPKTAPMTAGMSVDALLDQGQVADAVRFLAGQSARGMTHELVLTPSGSVWVP